MENDFTLDDVIKAGFKNMGHSELDYVKDGLLYCGVCNGKKEKIVRFFNGSERKVACACKCDIARREKEIERFELEEEKRKIERLRLASLMDGKYNDACLDNFRKNGNNDQLFNMCSRYVNAFSRFVESNQGLLFYGDVGTGKTYAAACIANELISKGTSVLMTSFVKVLEMIRKGPDEEKEIMNQIKSAKLVIFDDLGSERSTDYALEKIYEVVDERYRVGLPMILTTNLMLKDMISESDIRYKRIYDRIFEVCYPMEVRGTSWRKAQGNDRFKQMKELLEE